VTGTLSELVVETGSSTRHHRRWCLFTSAGDYNDIRLWVERDTPRRWDLVVAYYGDNDQEFSEIRKISSYAFRQKGGKFQNLKKLLAANPKFFNKYTRVWICDDDILMSSAEINEAFAISEFYDFWIAQPSFHPEGKNFHPIDVFAGPQWDYRLVNFIECGAAIFRRDKLIQFLAVFDGSLTGSVIDYWYMNFFKANKLRRYKFFRASELGRFAIIDKVQVTNPYDEQKKGREIDRLEPMLLRYDAWLEAMKRYDLEEFEHKVFFCGKIDSHRSVGVPVTSYDVAWQIVSDLVQSLTRKKHRGWNAFMDFRFQLRHILGQIKDVVPRSSAAQPQLGTLAERLGYDPQARLLIVHADDFGVAHSVNAAVIKGLSTGLINSASVMVPCSWFPEAAAFARAHPDVDLGIHLTLTSERSGYRWGPTVSPKKASTLIDHQGYLRQTWFYNTYINTHEVEVELRAQIDKAYSSGLRPTHLDSHQLRLQTWGRRLFEVYLGLGRRYDLPVFVSRDWFADFPYLRQALTPRDVVIDHTVTIGPEIDPEKWEAFYQHAIANLKPGVTQLVIHPGLDGGELQAWGSPRWGASWRQRDFDFFTSDEFRTQLEKCSIRLITWRELWTRLRKR
jgi:chitin disaccharide deacetylase